jgi:hypothetical protein
LGVTATVRSFPLSKLTGGGGATPAFSGQLVYLQFTWEVPLPHFPVELFSHSHSFKLSCSKVAGWGLLLLPSLASLFIYSSVMDCLPSLLFGAQGAHPLCYMSFVVVVVVYSVGFFLFIPWVGVSLSRGLY